MWLCLWLVMRACVAVVCFFVGVKCVGCNCLFVWLFVFGVACVWCCLCLMLLLMCAVVV